MGGGGSRLYLGVVEDCPPAGGHPAAQQTDLVQVSSRVDLGSRDLYNIQPIKTSSRRLGARIKRFSIFAMINFISVVDTDQVQVYYGSEFA